MSQTSVLYDAPGPRAVRRARIGTAVAILAFLGLAVLVALGLEEGEDHPATDEQLVGLAEQVVDERADAQHAALVAEPGDRLGGGGVGRDPPAGADDGPLHRFSVDEHVAHFTSLALRALYLAQWCLLIAFQALLVWKLDRENADRARWRWKAYFTSLKKSPAAKLALTARPGPAA